MSASSVLTETQRSSFREALRCGTEESCTKNPGHGLFFNFSSLTMTDIPEQIRNTNMLNFIKLVGKRTVHIELLQHNELGDHCGTGFVIKFWNQFYLCTNHHVINSSHQIKSCKIRFQYDRNDREGILETKWTALVSEDTDQDISISTFEMTTQIEEFLSELEICEVSDFIAKTQLFYMEKTFDFDAYVIKVVDRYFLELLDDNDELTDIDLKSARCQVTFSRGEKKTFDAELCKTNNKKYIKCPDYNLIPDYIRSVFNRYEQLGAYDESRPIPCFVVSHPHGKEKRVSFGNFRPYIHKTSEGKPIICHTAPTCQGSSGAAVFPIGVRELQFRCLVHSHREPSFSHYPGEFTTNNFNIIQGGCYKQFMKLKKSIKLQLK
ncbi:uncharacterized protein LOC126808544 [Patella vulgata]|uniref:uncharacterized protein LOC126808544 n=1 Tax=Patella vulgata TaxID=6465 RepID=UPI0024A88CBA|nr:uncharacterized protein LOC126808544 [Patella vulgata]XP_050389339.2 uncharacterized protein LOC126808544 [Patella vulgata]